MAMARTRAKMLEMKIPLIPHPNQTTKKKLNPESGEDAHGYKSLVVAKPTEHL